MSGRASISASEYMLKESLKSFKDVKSSYGHITG